MLMLSFLITMLDEIEKNLSSKFLVQADGCGAMAVGGWVLKILEPAEKQLMLFAAPAVMSL